MRFLILSEDFEGLHPWLFEDLPPEGMPAAYHFFRFLGNSEKIQFRAIIVNKKISRNKQLKNGSVIHLHRLISFQHYLWKFFGFILTLLLGMRTCRRNKYDVIYGMGFYGLAATLIGRYHRTPAINRKYGCLMMDLLQQRKFLSLYTRHIFEVAAFKLSPDLLISTQAGMRTEEVARYFNPHINISPLYNGIEGEYKSQLLKMPLVTKLPGKGDELRIGYIARLGISKRQDLAIGVVEHLVRKLGIRKVKMEIIGSGQHLGRIQKLIRQKELEPYIDLVPAVPHHKLPGIMMRHHISLFCYDGGVMGNILWESMLAGRLICIRATGDHHLFTIHNSIKITPEGFISKMSESIYKLLGQDVKELCQSSRNLADELITNWETRFSREIELIRQIRPLPNPPKTPNPPVN